MSNYELLITVNPTMESPVIDKCQHQGKCEITMANSMTIACLVQGIRPAVDLEWDILHDNPKEVISLEKDKHITEKADGTFDVSIEGRFERKDITIERLHVVCKGTDETIQPFLPNRLSTNFTLVFTKGMRFFFIPVLIKMNKSTNGLTEARGTQTVFNFFFSPY